MAKVVARRVTHVLNAPPTGPCSLAGPPRKQWHQGNLHTVCVRVSQQYCWRRRRSQWTPVTSMQNVLIESSCRQWRECGGRANCTRQKMLIMFYPTSDTDVAGGYAPRIWHCKCWGEQSHTRVKHAPPTGPCSLTGPPRKQRHQGNLQCTQCTFYIRPSRP